MSKFLDISSSCAFFIGASNMGLRLKFNLVIFITLAVGMLASGLIANEILQEHARQEVLMNAEIMMGSAKAIRKYTVKEIKPLLEHHLTEKFLPQTVPAYAATQNFNSLTEQYPEFFYKEATLNPTNLAHKASDWQEDIIEHFKRYPDEHKLVGERETPTGRSLYLSQPMRIQSEGCLTCHSHPGNAPQSMIDLYGSQNGFGWKLNEVIGAQIVSVPMTLPLARAHKNLMAFLIALAGVFIMVAIVLNILLSRMVIKPITSIATQADAVSLGKTDIEEFELKGSDELVKLSKAFNRMHRSLKSAMMMIDGSGTMGGGSSASRTSHSRNIPREPGSSSGFDL